MKPVGDERCVHCGRTNVLLRERQVDYCDSGRDKWGTPVDFDDWWWECIDVQSCDAAPSPQDGDQ